MMKQHFEMIGFANVAGWTEAELPDSDLGPLEEETPADRRKAGKDVSKAPPHAT